MTNMIFDGVFNDLTVDQTVALLSCFVHKEGSKDGQPKMKQDMQGPHRLLQEAARHVAVVFSEAKLEVDEEEYVQSFNAGLIDVVYAWYEIFYFRHLFICDSINK
jgi:ATP-dependent RNA helicase DOB1